MAKRFGEAAQHVETTLSELEARLEIWYGDKLRALSFEVVPLEHSDTTTMLKGFFGGKPPFGSVRQREDIPDGLILAAVQRVLSEAGKAVLVCHDNRLREGAKASGCIVYATIPELLTTEPVASMHATPCSPYGGLHKNKAPRDSAGRAVQIPAILGRETSYDFARFEPTTCPL